MNKFTFLALAVSFLLMSSISHGAVWTSEQSWNQEWETKFTQWMQESWGKNFFSMQKNANGEINPFYGVRVDCADTVYSSRIIFSYLNHLPFAINDPTGGKKLITNEMSRWNKLPENKRIVPFLQFLYNIVSTKSLPRDTYPVAMDRQSIIPGRILLTVEKNHHSWTIKNIFSTGVPHLVYNSTVGAYSSLVLQERKSWPNGEWVFEEDNTPKGNAGIRFWKKLEDLKTPAWQVSGYSEDQYQLKPTRWKYDLQKLLQTEEESEDQRLLRVMENVCADIRQRVDAVSEAEQFKSEQFLKTGKQECLSEADFDIYSTPSRDRRLADELVELRTSYRELIRSQTLISLSEKTKNRLAKIFPFPELSVAEESLKQKRRGIDAASICTVQYESQSEKTKKSVDMAEIKRRLFNKKFSSNPNDPSEVRFGQIVPGYKNSCESWGNLDLVYGEEP